MRTSWRAALLVAAAMAVVAGGSLAAGGISPAVAAETGWTADLASGEASGVVVGPDGVRLDRATAFSAPAEPTSGALTEGGPDASGVVPTGLLTLDPQALAAPTSRVRSVVTGSLPPGTTAGVDVRGRTTSGNWTEWVPSTEGLADLPVATREVQGRLVLTGSAAGADPAVRSVRLSAVAAPAPQPVAEAAPLSYNVFATREGLVGGTTANGHVITERDHFVALPSRRALSPRDRSDYSVKVCAPNGRCAFAPVWDVGPWNTRDDYWNPADRRQEWKDLPQGVPQSQAAYRSGYNGGNDQYGRKVLNPAGIDLGDGVFWDALGLKNNSQVQVDYLWTGSVKLAKVATVDLAGLAEIRAAPNATAPVVGVAANLAGVPAECAVGGFLRIGTGQFLSTAVLPDALGLPACPAQ